MLLLLFILMGCCLSLPSDPRHRSIPQSDIIPSLSIPGVEFRRAQPFPNPHKVPVARKGSYHVKLKRLPNSHSHRQPSAAAFFAEHHSGVDPEPIPTGNISVVDYHATQYAVEVVLDGSPVNLILNTGGSDTWVRASNFTCMNNASDPSNPHCYWGKYGASGFRDGPIKDQHFAIKNKDRSWLNGRLGFMNVTIGNIAVKGQEVGIATRGVWHGDNVTSGMLGMAYPSLTSAYWGNDLNDTNDANFTEYTPFFTSMVKDGLIEPSWGIAINRNSSDGVFSLGQLFPINVNHTNTAMADLFVAKMTENPTTAYTPSYYAIICNGFRADAIDFGYTYAMIFDSATTLTYIPPDVADIVNGKFDPPAIYHWQYGSYFVPCNATPPRFAVMVGNSPFYINPVDMINQDIVDPETGCCQTAISKGLDEFYVLGLTFLTNVAVGFDIENAKIHVHARDIY